MNELFISKETLDTYILFFYDRLKLTLLGKYGIQFVNISFSLFAVGDFWLLSA